jgi:predicted phage-related endonuclease
MLPTTKSKEWHDARRSGIGGSDANIIMSGDPERIHDLWLVKTGQKEPDDLSDKFQVMLGSATEAFNLSWFEKVTGLSLMRDVRVETSDFQRATLDGLCETHIVEAKHTHARTNMQEVLARYQPQLHHNMMVAGKKRAYLSVILGNEYDYIEVEYDEEYALRLVEREREFWECVTLRLPPGNMGEKIQPPEATRTVDMQGNNEWAFAAHEWLMCKNYATQFDKAADTIKKLVAADVRSAAGHGITVTRDKRRALRIKEG